MAMTAAVKDEISRLPVTRTCCRKAEVSAILRFAGGLHLVSGRIVIEAELDTGIAARRRRPRTAIQVISTWAAIIGAGAASRAWPPQASAQVFTPESAAHTPPTRSTRSRAPIARASRRGTASAVVVASGVVVTMAMGVPLGQAWANARRSARA